MLQNVSLFDRKVDHRSRQFEVRSPARDLSLRGVLGVRGLFEQVRAVKGVYFLELIAAGEIEDHSTGVAVHLLGSALFYMDIAGESSGVQQILTVREKELSLICARADLRCHFGGIVR